jgi:hypothetical protein
MIEKFRLWLGSRVISLGLWLMGFGKTKWQAVSLMGEAPKVQPIWDEREKLRATLDNCREYLSFDSSATALHLCQKIDELIGPDPEKEET